MTNCLITPLLIELQVHVYLKLIHYSLDDNQRHQICMSMKVLSVIYFLGSYISGHWAIWHGEGEAMPKSVEWL